MLGKTGMTESGLGGTYWFCATHNGVNCRNVTYKGRLGTTSFNMVEQHLSDIANDILNIDNGGY